MTYFCFFNILQFCNSLLPLRNIRHRYLYVIPNVFWFPLKSFCVIVSLSEHEFLKSICQCMHELPFLFHFILMKHIIHQCWFKSQDLSANCNIWAINISIKDHRLSDSKGLGRFERRKRLG